jgi:hypothetical protein
MCEVKNIADYGIRRREIRIAMTTTYGPRDGCTIISDDARADFAAKAPNRERAELYRRYVAFCMLTPFFFMYPITFSQWLQTRSSNTSSQAVPSTPSSPTKPNS